MACRPIVHPPKGTAEPLLLKNKMQSLQTGLRSARLLSAACRSETLHAALSVAQRAMTTPCQSVGTIPILLRHGVLKDAGLPRVWSGISNVLQQQCLFEECVDVPVQSRVTAVLHTPTDISVLTGPMLRLEVQVACLSHVTCSSLVFQECFACEMALPCR